MKIGLSPLKGRGDEDRIISLKKGEGVLIGHFPLLSTFFRLHGAQCSGRAP
jgi:hypothetical protein